MNMEYRIINKIIESYNKSSDLKNSKLSTKNVRWMITEKTAVYKINIVINKRIMLNKKLYIDVDLDVFRKIHR